MHRVLYPLAVFCSLWGLAALPADAAGATGGIPADAKYACPMDRHPDEANSEEQGPYFAEQPGKCPRCGMKLQPLDELEWVRVRRAAGSGEVAYTCPDHQHVFSETAGECPRCGKGLEPFKVMYTCPDAEHAGVVRTRSGNCPHCGRGLAAFRGVWLDEKMAAANVPPHSGPAESAPYHCSIHPLVHSDNAANCTICARPLVSSEAEGGGTQTADADEGRRIPPGAKFTCPMKVCWRFSAEPGECPACGMSLQPVEDVAWVKGLRRQAGRAYLCPMHPDTQRSDGPGTCDICGMQLVAESDFRRPRDAPSRIAAQIDYITEHYLELQRLLSSDKTADVARQALGIAAASEELLKHVDDPSVEASDELESAVTKLHAAALKTTGSSLEKDRVTFVELSAAMRTLINEARPDRKRWPDLYIFHCPMSKGDWVQTSPEKSNPYYGFKMLRCGKLREVK